MENGRKVVQTRRSNQLYFPDSKGEVAVIRPEDIQLDRANGLLKGRIITGIYRGNLIEYKLKYDDQELTVQAMTKEAYQVGEEVFFHFERAAVIL